jgi:hypothetical protein
VTARRLRREQRALVDGVAQVVAEVAAGSGSIRAEALAHRLADLCEHECPAFDRQRFLTVALPRVWRGGRWRIVDRRAAPRR